MVELRGLWVTRFDWTLSSHSKSPAKIDEIVNNAAYAGFNAIFFQVRGNADAFYDSQIEPWSDRLTGTLGQDPGWDPLAYLISQAHAKGIQVHAYLNIYPVWTGCGAPPDGTTPRHLYYLVRDYHGTTNGKLNGLQWYSNEQVACSSYQRTTPASIFVDNHLLKVDDQTPGVDSVLDDLVSNYDLDGIHLDHIRYESGTSFDPVSNAYFNAQSTYARDDWQRRQVNGTVSKFYDQIQKLDKSLWLSAAVWPIYKNDWGWPTSYTGYSTYYQDSKEWIGQGYIDSIFPMIYPGTFNCPDDSFWTQSRWNTLVSDFNNDRAGRFVIPGIGTGYCTFDEIAARINMARSIGTAGHALFSYSGLLSRNYFDDLANGPYAVPATVPDITWH